MCNHCIIMHFELWHVLWCMPSLWLNGQTYIDPLAVPSAAIASDPPHTLTTAVTVKVPPFWSADPEVWFVQVEAQFTCCGITAQRTRFDYVVSLLNLEFATKVHNLLLRPPSEHPYDMLKAKLIKRTATSEQHKLQQLISGEEFSDSKPTQLL